MALKLTRTAAETLNDILLHALQENGLEKMEVLEQAFFDHFDQLSASLDPLQEDSTSTFVVNNVYAIIYKRQQSDTVVLAIVHSSRLSQTSNL